MSREVYCGANLIRERLIKKDSDKWFMSNLAVKVANILGQAFKGIDNLKCPDIDNHDTWKSDQSISITLYGEITNFDDENSNDEALTRLYLCCHAANVAFQITGSKKGFLKFIFEHSIIAISDQDIYRHCPNFDAFIEKSLGISTDTTIAQQIPNLVHLTTRSDRIEQIRFKTKNLEMESISEMLLCANYSNTKLMIAGNNPRGNTLVVQYERSEPGTIPDRRYLNINFGEIVNR